MKRDMQGFDRRREELKGLRGEAAVQGVVPSLSRGWEEGL